MESIFQSSKNSSLREKLAKSGIKLPRTVTSLLQLDNLVKCLIVKDLNSMGYIYFRFLAWFKEDDTPYFCVCDWDKDTPYIDTWQNEQRIQSQNNIFKVIRPDINKIYTAELIRI